MTAHPERRDPLEEERKVEVDREVDDDVPAHPSLGAPPRRDKDRPVFRNSQLEEGENAEGSRLRG